MASPSPPQVIVIMGVSGSGKTTVGTVLAKLLQCHFYDADDYHPQANIDKMKRGEALNDADRLPWLQKLADIIGKCVSSQQRVVLACSALKPSYRSVLTGGASLPRGAVGFVLLHPSTNTLRKRLEQRTDHFMPASLLESQQSTLEVDAGDELILTRFEGEAAEQSPGILASLIFDSIWGSNSTADGY